MTEDDVFERTGQAYFCLIHPVMKGNAYRQELAPVLAVSDAIPDSLIAKLIVGASWRERLIGLSLAMTRRSGAFIDQMLASLHNVRGISIVPTCAALAVLGRRGLFDPARVLAGSFDRTPFDGEVGWALDIAVRYAAGELVSATERGPNYGQFFGHQVEMYEWILDGQPAGGGNSAPPLQF